MLVVEVDVRDDWRKKQQGGKEDTKEDDSDKDFTTDFATNRILNRSQSSDVGSRRSKRKRSLSNCYEDPNSYSQHSKDVVPRSQSKTAATQRRSIENMSSREFSDFQSEVASVTEPDQEQISIWSQKLSEAADSFETLRLAIEHASDPPMYLNGAIFEEFRWLNSIFLGSIVDFHTASKVDVPDTSKTDVASLTSLLNMLTILLRGIKDERVIRSLLELCPISKLSQRAELLCSITKDTSTLWTSW